MGVVYLAYDHVRRMDVALKTLRNASGGTLYRFKREFRSLAGIIHPNLVTLYELQSTGGEWAFTMAKIDGCSFLQHVRPYEAPVFLGDDTSEDEATVATDHALSGADSAPGSMSRARSRRRRTIVDAELDLQRLRATLPQLAEGVQALHANGKLHRDLKPSNVLVERGGRVVICDFGLVAEVAPDEDAPGQGFLVGTPAYMSPEQAAGSPVGTASDWYSFGVMLYEALTGCLPFDGDTDLLLLAKRLEEAPPPSKLCADLPADLEALCVALLQRDAKLRPSGPEILNALGCTGESATPLIEAALPFVGRERQLAALQDALEGTVAGRGVSVFVHGPSGMGKSSLIGRFLEQAQERCGALVLKGRCYIRESVPYKALDSVVDALSSYLERLSAADAKRIVPSDIEALARLFPVLRRARNAAEPEVVPDLPADPQELRRRAFVALRSIFVRLASERPVIVFIDDLQWGDADSALFLNELLFQRNAPPLLFLGSYRKQEEATSPLLRILLAPEHHASSSTDVRSLEVDALDANEARHLILDILNDHSHQAQIRADEIAREAKGSPFFIAELAASARTGGAEAAGLGLSAVLGQRIARLPRDARTLLTTCAVAGRPIPTLVASRAAGVKDEANALASLLAERLVVVRGAAGEEEIETYHDQVRRSAVDSLSERDTRHCHRRLARSIESSNQADPISLVAHWLGAGERARAGAYAAKAAAQAERAMAFERAAHHYQLVLELSELDDGRRRKVQRLLGDALVRSGRLRDAANIYLTAAKGAERRQNIELRRVAFEQLLRSGRPEEGLALAREVLLDIGVPLPRTRFGGLLSAVYHRARLVARGFDFQPLPAEQRAPEQRLRLDTYWSMTSGIAFVNPILGAAVRMRYLRDALDAGDTFRAALALTTEIGFRGQKGGKSREQTDEVAAMAQELGRQSGQPTTIGFSNALHGMAHMFRGEFERGYALICEAEKILLDHSTGSRWEIDLTRLYRLNCLVFMGRIAELTEQVPFMLAKANEAGDEFMASSIRCWRSNLAWLAIDRPDEARQQVADSRIKDGQGGSFVLRHYFQLLSLAQILLYDGDGAAAHGLVESRWRSLKKSMLLRVQSLEVEAVFLRGRCAIAAAATCADKRNKLLQRAQRCARRLERVQLPWATAFAQLLYAGGAAMRGDEAAAIEALRSAESACEQVHMSLLAQVARYRRGELQGDAEGEALVAGAVRWMREQKVAAPERMVGMYAPGFPQ